jgi:hypothetical protein
MKVEKNVNRVLGTVSSRQHYLPICLPSRNELLSICNSSKPTELVASCLVTSNPPQMCTCPTTNQPEGGGGGVTPAPLFFEVRQLKRYHSTSRRKKVLKQTHERGYTESQRSQPQDKLPQITPSSKGVASQKKKCGNTPETCDKLEKKWKHKKLE